jgi:hypothetical protein
MAVHTCTWKVILCKLPFLSHWVIPIFTHIAYTRIARPTCGKSVIHLRRIRTIGYVAHMGYTIYPICYTSISSCMGGYLFRETTRSFPHSAIIPFPPCKGHDIRVKPVMTRDIFRCGIYAGNIHSFADSQTLLARIGSCYA